MSFQKPTLSLCMIVKNEAENLPHCLEPIKDVFDQIVIVDTGSSDNTVEVAKSYGTEVHYFEWIDDFSAARNESLKYATGDYIFFLDGDDRMEHAEALKLKELITPEKDVAFYCLLFCYEASGQDTETFQLRLFPNLPGVEFEGLVHEQVVYSLQRLKIRSQVCDVKITHIGYQDADASMQKIHRNIPLLLKQIQKTPERVNVRLHMVMHYNALGEIEKSTAELEHLIKQTEEEDGYREAFLICCVMLGNNYRKVNKFDAAIKMYRRALEVEPDYGLAHFLLGELYCKLGRIPEARMELIIAQNTGIQLCRTPISRRAIYYYISYFLGRCHEEKGDMNLAIMEYKQAIAIEPLSAEVYTRLGNIYMQRGQYEEAQEAFNQAAQLSKGSIASKDALEESHKMPSVVALEAENQRLGLSSEAYRNQRLFEAERSEAVHEVTARSQYHNQAVNHCNLGVAYLYQGKLKEAESVFKKAINIDPQHVEAYSNLGLVYAKQNNFTKAENSYLKALQMEPNRIEALTNLAYLYLRAGKVNEAEERFLRASEIEPKAVDIHLALALIYAQRHQLASVQKATDDFVLPQTPTDDFVLPQTPTDDFVLPQETTSRESGLPQKQYDEIIYNRPELAMDESMSMQQSRFSIPINQQGKDHAAQLAEAFRFMGEQLLDRNRVAEAILAFQVAAAINPCFVEVLGGLAELYQHVRNYKEAIEMYETVLRAEPKNYSAFYQLGECYLATGASQAARLCYLHALELNPDYQPAWERMTNIELNTQKEGRLT